MGRPVRARRDGRRLNKRGETIDQTVSRVHAQFPSTAENRDWWYEKLAERDYAMLGAILHDVLNIEVIAERGTARRGTRPPLDYIEGMAKLRQLRGYDYSTEPFHIAFRSLAGERSRRHVARLCCMSVTQVQRLLTADITPTGEEMEKVAAGFFKYGTYFKEYRIGVVCALTARLLEDDPEKSVSIVRALTATGQ